MTIQQESGQQVRFRPRRLGHANLFVGDLERSMRFYNQICGLQEVFREPAINAGFLSNGNTHHDVAVVQVSETSLIGRDSQVLVSEGWGKRAGLFHLGFEMENEAGLVAAYRRAQQAGVRILMTVDHQLARSVYLFDPEGNLLEFYADTTKDWRGVFAAFKDELVTGPWTPGKRPPTAESHYPVDPEIRRVADAVFHPRRITHAALAVRDFESSLRFYTEVAGLQEVVGMPDGAFAVLRGTCPGYDLALFQAGEDRPVGLHHIGFELPDERELDEAEAQMRGNGIEAELRLDHATKRSLFLQDPDGIRLEFYVKRLASLDRLSTDVQPYLA